MPNRRSRRMRRNRRRTLCRRRGGAAAVLRIAFGAQQVQPGSILPIATVQQPFTFHIDANPNQLFTIMVYDLNAVVPTFIHYLVINFKNNDVTNGNILYDYMPPAPPAGTGRHEYVVLIGLQSSFVQPPPVHEERGGHDIDLIIESFEFERMAAVNYFVDAPEA